MTNGPLIQCVTMLSRTGRYLCCLFLGTIALAFAYGADISSTATGGNWNATGSWGGGGLPVAGDNVTIVAGAVITVNVNSQCLSLIINGTLTRSLGNLTVNGSFTNNGTINNFPTGGTVTMAGTVSATIGGVNPVTVYNLIINKTAGSGVTLSQPLTVNNILTLTAGVLSTDAANVISLTNTAVTALAGAPFSATKMINGPLRWTLATTATNYTFPVGSGTTYLPFILNAVNSAAGNRATVQAFNTGSGGSGLNLSATEYWSMSTDAGLGTTGSTVSISRPTAISPYNLIGRSTTANGTYTSLAGTVGANGITGSNDIGTTSPWFFAFAMGAITTGTVSGSPFCAGATGINVPFTYSPAANFPAGTCTFTAELSDGSGSFATPSTLQSVVSNASGSQSVVVSIPMVPAGTGYRIRIVSNAPAVNGADNAANLEVSSTPTVATGIANGPISTTTATLNGTVSANGVSTSVTFNYGTSIAYGSNATAAQSPVTTQSTAVSAAITGLTPNTLYHFRVNSTNGTCPAAGADATFTTLPNAPVVGTATSPASSGFTANWLAPAIPGTATFTYTVQASTDPAFGTISATGSAIPSGTTTYVFTMLLPSTTYYYRVMAVNATGNSAWSATSASITTTNGIDYYNTGNVAGNLTTSWTTSPTGVGGTLLSAGSNNFTSGDVFHIRTGTTVTTTAPWTISGTSCRLNINGTLTLSHAFGISGIFANNGTFNAGSQTVTFGTGGDITGTNASTFYNLVIATTSAADIVTLSRSDITIRQNSGGGTLTLQNGIFQIGAGHILYFDNNSGTNGLVNNGGNLATTGLNGADGGRVVLMNGSGANFNITGTGTTHFYDLSFGTAVGAGNRRVVQSNPGRVVINGTLTMPDNQSRWATNSPIYGPNATLYINNNNQGYSPGAGERLEWMAMASGTIGTTAGYPNHVTIVNVGTSLNNGTGFGPSGSWSIQGTLSIGDGTVAGTATLQSMTAFTCGGIIIDHNSTLKHGASTTFTIKGNWRRQGSTMGLFVPIAAGTTVIFGGNGNATTPQTISISSGTETFGNSFYSSVTLNNGTYVRLGSPVTLQPSNIFTLTNGILETTATNILYIRNTAVTGITGAGTSATYINGPVRWDIALAAKYTVPLGKNNAYLPFDITPLAAAANTITVEAFDADCTGAPDGTTVLSISNTEYWALSASNSFASGATVSAARTSGIGAFNMLAKSTAAAGIYSAIGGTTGTVGSIPGIVNGNTGNASPWYLAIAFGPLSITVTSISYPTCTGNEGAITVAGSGGVPPYSYNINGGSYQPSGTFNALAAGVYSLGVMDNIGTIRTIDVELDVLVVTTDTGTCTGGSVQLQANTSTAWSYSWTPATGLSSTTISNPVANPASTTTYTVSAIVVDNTVNLIANPGFESGATGFASGYIHHTCGAYASSWNPPTGAPWPCNGNNGYGEFHNGIYKVVNNAQELCTNLASFGPRTGNSMMVIDGPNHASFTVSPYYFWRQDLTGLATNTYYVFTYWVRNAFNGDPNDNPPIIRTTINNIEITGTASYPNPYTVNTAAWTQISYLWYSGASTTATIEMYDIKVRDASNDFAIDDMSFYITCNPTKNVTVTINPIPTLDVVSQPGTACIGDGAVISLTGLTPNSTFTASYSINGITQIPVAGILSDASGNASFNSAALSALNNGQVLQVSSLINTTGSSNCSQSFTGKTVTLAVSTFVTWLNTGDTDWNTSSNWCGGIPTATTNVLIPDYGIAGTYPVIANGDAGFTNNIIISGNASVTINAGASLAVSGTYTSSGNLVNNGELIFNSSAIAQSFPGATGNVGAMHVLRVNNTSGENPAVIFNRSFAITGALLPDAGVINVQDAFVTLASTATATARAGVTGATSGFSYTGTGLFIVQRYFPARRGWRLVAAPIKSGAPHTIAEAWQEQTTGRNYTAGSWAASVAADTVAAGFATQITGGTMANGFDQGLRNNPSIKYFNAGSWPSPANTNNTLVNSQEGWMLFVRGDRVNYGEITDQYKAPTSTTLRPRGQLYTGGKSVTSSGLTVVGNPYASSVDYLTMTRTGAGWPAAPAYYVWDPYLGGSEGVGAFVALTWDNDNNVFLRSAPLTGTGTSNYDNRYIPSGAAIMVDFPAGGGTLELNETDKVAFSATNAFRPAPLKTQQRFRIVLNTVQADKSTDITDGILVLLGQQYNNAADENDARKLGNFNENIVIEKDSKLLVIERRKIYTEYDTIFLGQYRMQRKTYQLECIAEGNIAAPGVKAFLEDKYLKTSVPISLQGNTKINFTITADAASAAADRFRIVFNRNTVSSLQADAVVQKTDVEIQWNIAPGAVINRYEVERSKDGIFFEKVATVKTNNRVALPAKYKWIDVAPVPALYQYRIRAVNEFDEAIYSEPVQADLQNGVPFAKVYPNPVMDGIIRLQMNSMPAGAYKATLADGSGKVLQVQSFRYNANTATVEIAGKALSAGVYLLELVGPGGLTATEKIFFK